MVGTRPAINILDDIVFTLIGYGQDDGNPDKTTRTPDAAGAMTLKVDKVAPNFKRTLSNHNTAQDDPEFNRISGKPQTIQFETKLQKSSATAAKLITMLKTNEICGFMATSAGFSINDGAGTPSYALGIIGDVDISIDSPSTISFTVSQYGTMWEYSGV